MLRSNQDFLAIPSSPIYKYEKMRAYSHEIPDIN